MFGKREDSLNYPLIMEGFYYDAEIEHIAEILKNSLYFAVLEGENNKVLKSTHDTYYFSIDDELVYTNYYFDFGPLNISCLYKYCCNLGNYLTYSQGLKRVVHYTTANPAKRVNAAFLMGSYAVIYLKMEPKEIHRILLNTGGQFKHFLDASQGFSQYTIDLLDCLHAIQKALTFNFFNFTDFKVEEYDLYDKLQNGDMNWLLPRKFLAFIGPTDSEYMNGHSPDFYVKYFLENDVKTVIRLNNKMYDASVFANVGIEHHELFFPDGTTPTKQILLRFLDMSENARAAIAVHCKAGLGRTGSLIGAYIIKHYHMTAHETIAWMRICRPGSVIGQQQGWLEKIEGWLWKQGSLYRVQHFGDGDKIPHHKYGIYSKEWPKEREKLIRHIQRRKIETQCNYTWNKHGGELMLKSNNPKSPVHNYLPEKASISRNLNSLQKSAEEERYKKVSKLFNKIQRSSNSGNRMAVPVAKSKDVYRVEDIDSEPYQSDSKMKMKQSQYKSKYKARNDIEVESQTNKPSSVKQKKYIHTAPTYYDSYEPEVRSKLDSSNTHDTRPFQRFRKRIQSEPRELSVEGRSSVRIKKNFVDNLKQTQGDKLNDIKARRFAGCMEGESSVNRIKQSKSKRRYLTTTNLDMASKPETRLTKRQVEGLYPSKRSHLDQLYTSRN